MQEHPFVAVDEGDLGLAARRRGEARIVGEGAGILVERGDVDHLWADGSVLDVELERFALVLEFRRRFGHRELLSVWAAPRGGKVRSEVAGYRDARDC